MVLVRRIFFTLTILSIIGCTNSMEDVNALTTGLSATKDVGENVRMIYSDSARVQVIVEGPRLERYNSNVEPREVFTDGVKITFLDERKNPSSWLTADMAIRTPKTKKMTVRGNATLYNKEDKKLKSEELIWDEDKGILYTDKFVRITIPSKGDTIYGVGFETDKDFEILKIRRRVQGVVTMQEQLGKKNQ